MTVMHYLTPNELHRMLDTTPGSEHLAEVVEQLINGVSPVRVDFEKLPRKPDDSKGSLPPL
jgi:hypothetical protein